MDANNLISDFQLQFPVVVSDMLNSNHHYDDKNLNPYHLEGDVWTHTNLVVIQARNMLVNDKVLFAALLHDIGKPITREEKHDTKRVRFFNHGEIGSFISIPTLDAFGVDDDDKRYIIELINRHTDIFQNLKEESGRVVPSVKLRQKYQQQEISFICDLVDLATCDGMGRFCFDKYQDKDRYQDWKDDFRQHWTGRRKRTKLTNHINLLIGPPLSGKSTWIEKYGYDTKVISRDALIMKIARDSSSYTNAWNSVDQKKVDLAVHEMFRIARQGHENITIDMTNMSIKTRKKWLSQIPKYYQKRAIVFMTDYVNLHTRNDTRNKEEGKFIPEEVIKRMCSNFQVPLYSEFDKIDWVFN